MFHVSKIYKITHLETKSNFLKNALHYAAFLIMFEKMDSNDYKFFFI